RINTRVSEREMQIRANSQKSIFSLFVYRTACAAAGRSCRAIQQGDAPRANSLRLGRVSLRASSRNVSSPVLSSFLSRLPISAGYARDVALTGLVVAPKMATKRGSG